MALNEVGEIGLGLKLVGLFCLSLFRKSRRPNDLELARIKTLPSFVRDKTVCWECLRADG